MLSRRGRFRLFLPSFRLQQSCQHACFRVCACYFFLNLKFNRPGAFECRAYCARDHRDSYPALPGWADSLAVGPPPDFLWNLVASVNFMRLSSWKGAHAVLSSAAWQEIRVRALV